MEVSQFSGKNVCLTVLKIFLKNASTVALVSGIEIVYDKRGLHDDLPSDFIVLQYRKIL